MTTEGEIFRLLSEDSVSTSDGGIIADREQLRQFEGVEEASNQQEEDLSINDNKQARRPSPWSVSPNKRPLSLSQETYTRASSSIEGHKREQSPLSFATILGGSRVEAKRLDQREKLSRSMVMANSSLPNVNTLLLPDDDSLPAPYEQLKKVFIIIISCTTLQ